MYKVEKNELLRTLALNSEQKNDNTENITVAAVVVECENNSKNRKRFSNEEKNPFASTNPQKIFEKGKRQEH